MSNSNSPNNVTTYTDQTITEPGLVITHNQQGIPDDYLNTISTFNTTDPINHVPQINENLVENITIYDNNSNSEAIVNEIRQYATQIKCEDFHGKGTIDDYTALFQAASQIANDTRQMQLNIDIDGFNEFGQAADELSALFANFTKRLQNINIINDSTFLLAVLNALKKIAHLSDVFGRFKETIIVTSEIKIPKSAHDTKEILENVMEEVNCAMNYINHFVTPDENLSNAQLSNDDKNIINKAINTIDNWKILCDQGVSIALNNNTDVSYLKQTNNELKQKTNSLKNATNKLKLKLTQLNCI